jgi:PIN domain nuclease of toxin-antitoxin system
VVLDASAVVEWLLARRDKAVIDRLMPFSIIPVPALTEALYTVSLKNHGLSAAELFNTLIVAGTQLEGVTDEDAIRAAELITMSRLSSSTAGSLSLGDGLNIAFAERLGLPIIGGDQYGEALDLRVEYLPFR